MGSPSSYHFACFECRKSFSYEVSWKDPKSQQRICPECGRTLSNMGRRFKPPKRSDIKQWQKVELIHRAGRRDFPKYLWQAKNKVQINPNESEGEKLLRKLRPKHKP
jgi:hypothetical protein